MIRGGGRDMVFEYEDIDEYEDKVKGYCFDECSQCNDLLEISMEHIKVEISDKFIDIEEIPMLKCKKCGTLYYTEYAKVILRGLYKELCNTGNCMVTSKPNGYRKKYNYASGNNFIYDHRDYESIPGLMFDDEHSEVGFLTPVYFDRKALLYFISDPEYEVDIFSETYGHIGKRDREGFYQYEWDVPFGFNTNGKLIFWLGDLDSMDEFSKGILSNFNLPSDHLLIGSEFYQAQMKCIFSNPIKEQQILLNKKNFIRNIKDKYRIDLKHLDEECEIQSKNVKRPIVFNEQSVSGVINALDKILVEGINVAQLRVLYEKMCDVDVSEKEHKKWQSIRLLKEILIKLSSNLDKEIDIEKLMSPLYILHDYRIYLDHLLSDEEQKKSKQHIVDTLQANNFGEQEKIYFEEIRRLDILFQHFVLLSK